MKICKHCNKEYSSKDSRSKFCSRTCSGTYYNMSKIKTNTCLNCLVEFRPKHRIQKTCSYNCKYEYNKKQRNAKLLSGELQSFRVAKLYLVETNNKCSICNMEPFWNGKPLKFIIDHIDGNPTNDHISNLRLVCHNCDSQLDTYKFRNAGNGRHYRKERYKNGQSF